MEFRTKKLLFGGAGLLGSALCGWYFYGKYFPFQKIRPVTPALLTQILKEEEREWYPILKYTAEFSSEYWEQAKEMRLKVTREAIQKMMDIEYPLIHEKLENANKNILKKYKVSEMDFTENMAIASKEDPELKDSIVKLNTDIENAYMGIAPQLTSKIPDFLTPEKTLKILQRLLEEGRNNFWKEFYALRRDKSFWASKEPIPPGLYGNFRTYLRLSDKKRRILHAEGLDGFDEAPERILDAAIAKYAAESYIFRERCEEMRFLRVEFDRYFNFPSKLLGQNLD